MNWDLLNKKISAIDFNVFGTIQPKTIISLLIIWGILFGFFFIVRRYIVPYLGSRQAVKKMRLIVFRTQTIVWTLYALFGIYQFLSDSIYITIALLLLVIFAGFNFWRDLFSSLAFRIENKIQVRDPVRYDTYNGVLQEVNPRNLIIKTDKEELVTIPFRKVSNSVFVKRQAKGKLHSAQITLQTAGKPADEVIPKVNEWIFSCPWAIANQNSSAKIIGSGLIQLTIYAVDIESINKTEDYLQQLIRK